MKKLFFVCLVMSALIVTVSSCKKDHAGTTTPPGGTSTNDINLATSPTLGRYLTNKLGQTLYFFSNDADGASSCGGACEAVWPAFTVDLSTAKLDTGLTASDFATITTAGGTKQVTYKGWPLYTYAPPVTGGYGGTTNQQEPAGSTKGDGVGGIWFVAKPDYTIMLANKQLTGLDGNNYKSDYTIGTGNTIYFTDGAGRTLYNFSIDSFNVNKFTKPDLSNNSVWPIYEQEQVVVPSVLDKTLFGTITVGGKKQLTYKGWPLYFFVQDTKRGLNTGVSVGGPGKWPVAVKDAAEARK